MQDVVIDVEIVEEFKILKNKAQMGYAKLSPLSIIELINGSIIDADAPPTRHNNAGDQIKQCGFPGSTGTNDSNLFMLINRKFRNIQKKISAGIRKL